MHVDAQISLSRILRPPDGFEDVYEGISASAFPIAIPGTLDFEAGKRGFDPDLIAGVSIPMGSRLLLWLPQPTLGIYTTAVYEYRILWRLRSAESQNAAAIGGTRNSPLQAGLLGHLPKNFNGTPDDNGANPNDTSQERLVLPCAMTSVAYEQTEPVAVLDDGVIHVRGERVSVRGRSYGPSQAPRLVPSGTVAVASQGVYSALSAPPGLQSGPLYMPYQTDAFGDEYIIIVTRQDVGASATWQFDGEDRGFSAIFGTDGGRRSGPLEGLGIYAFSGSGAT